jgi:hypothetical protein
MKQRQIQTHTHTIRDTFISLATHATHNIHIHTYKHITHYGQYTVRDVSNNTARLGLVRNGARVRG